MGRYKGGGVMSIVYQAMICIFVMLQSSTRHHNPQTPANHHNNRGGLSRFLGLCHRFGFYKPQLMFRWG